MMQRIYAQLAAFILLIGICLGVGSQWVAAQNEYRVYLPVVSKSSTNSVYTAQATYYFGADGSGNCTFDPIPGDLMVAAISYLNYSNPHPAAYCGAYAQVTGPKGTIMVRIVDKCPDVPDNPTNPTTGCGYGHLDLSTTAFDLIADRNLGRVPITWQIVSPNLSGPIAYHFKDGSNQWWTAVQIRNHRNPIAKFEYRNSSGQWVNVARTDYNYFVVETGMGAGPYTFRITDTYGNVLVDSGIVGGDNVSRNGAVQFPPGP
ncbi:expansin EXLX1 family cellulose-binding protein [Candidatus Oscillochloris fontis]|uniref:expansin EXLX1 family cellulose-binding protein n=1 Tax=Candidatus Oscillochloris fontis TaxID=2496868 RepID=UPI001EE8B2BD|nr:expansin EXLX1 family cellulose-binding protein [Candidatus Oscillochloris fontis]